MIAVTNGTHKEAKLKPKTILDFYEPFLSI